MNMTEVKTGDLIGPALDWAVAQADGSPDWGVQVLARMFHPSTDWEHGGPLIDKHDPEERRLPEPGRYAEVWRDLPGGCAIVGRAVGPTRLVAFCRALVACYLGEVVRVPAELVSA